MNFEKCIWKGGEVLKKNKKAFAIKQTQGFLDLDMFKEFVQEVCPKGQLKTEYRSPRSLWEHQ